LVGINVILITAVEFTWKDDWVRLVDCYRTGWTNGILPWNTSLLTNERLDSFVWSSKVFYIVNITFPVAHDILGNIILLI